MSVQHVNSSNFETVVKQSEKPVLVDFWASWCGPCRMIAPAVEEVAAQRPDILVCKVNVDEAQELAISYGVSSIPPCWFSKTARWSTNPSVPSRKKKSWSFYKN